MEKVSCFFVLFFDLFLTSRGSGVSGQNHIFLYFITMTDNFVYMDDFFSICSITAVFTSAVSSESENI